MFSQFLNEIQVFDLIKSWFKLMFRLVLNFGTKPNPKALEPILVQMLFIYKRPVNTVSLDR